MFVLNDNIAYQRTLKRETSCFGIGLHTGDLINVKFYPAEVGTGIIFFRFYLGKFYKILASWENVAKSFLCTLITNHQGLTISTTEHVLSAIYGLGIDNLIIEVDGLELPVMDGSSKIFVDLFQNAGIKLQRKPRKILKIIKKVEIEQDGMICKFSPLSEVKFSITFDIDFSHKIIGKQSFEIDSLNDKNYVSCVSSARTFGFMQDIEALRARGLALGGCLDNAIVLNEDRVLNPEGLRYADEFVRHKILDAIGDLALMGMPIIGKFYAFKSSHAHNNRLIVKLFSDTSNYQVITLA